MADRTVFCFCYDHNRATGGQKDTYKHVDALNGLGVNAVVFHRESGFRLTWFENTTPVIHSDEFMQSYRPFYDILVLPEDLGDKIASFSGHKVIFDKNIYYGFGALGSVTRASYPALDPNVKAILTVSEHNREHLCFAYPSVPIFRITPGIDVSRFCHVPLSEKKLQLIFPRKCQHQIATLMHILNARSRVGINRIPSSAWVPADGMTEGEMAQLLGESLVLLFLSTEEGLGLLPLEAVAAGCLVVSYGSGPLRETMPLPYQFEYGNLVAVASFIESVAALFPDRLDHLQFVADKAREAITLFSSSQHLHSVKTAWEQIFKLVDKAPPVRGVGPSTAAFARYVETKGEG